MEGLPASSLGFPKRGCGGGNDAEKKRRERLKLFENSSAIFKHTDKVRNCCDAFDDVAGSYSSAY